MPPREPARQRVTVQPPDVEGRPVIVIRDVAPDAQYVPTHTRGTPVTLSSDPEAATKVVAPQVLDLDPSELPSRCEQPSAAPGSWSLFEPHPAKEVAPPPEPEPEPEPATHMEGDFLLDRGEHIVRSREWGYIEGASLSNKSQMCLTNKNIRVIHRGMFNKMRKNGDVCLPLDKVEIHDGVPKMALDAHEEFSRLMITFDGEVRVINFATGKIAAGWANDISLLLVDKPFEPAQPILHPPFNLKKAAAETAGGVAGAVAGFLLFPLVILGGIAHNSSGGPSSGPDGN